MALNKPANFESRIEWINRHTRDAQAAIQGGPSRLGFTQEQLNLVTHIYDALTETLSVLEDLVKGNT